jgi:hypothetical protein
MGIAANPSDDRVDGGVHLVRGDAEALGEAAALMQQVLGGTPLLEGVVIGRVHLGERGLLPEGGGIADEEENLGAGGGEGAEAAHLPRSANLHDAVLGPVDDVGHGQGRDGDSHRSLPHSEQTRVTIHVTVTTNTWRW